MFPRTLSRLARPTSWPLRSIVARAVTPSRNGLTFDTASGGPAGTTTSWPASAKAGAPNTGHAINDAPRMEMDSDIRREVSGWTVEQSIMILEVRSVVVKRIAVTISSRAWSSPTQMKIIDAASRASAMEDATVALLGPSDSANTVALEAVRL